MTPQWNLKTEKMSARGYLFLTVMLFSSLKLMRGRSILSFFSAKKKPALAAEDKGWMMPAVLSPECIFPWPQSWVQRVTTDAL